MTDLTKDEWDRLEYLLGKDKIVGIDQEEMDEIIALLNVRGEHSD